MNQYKLQIMTPEREFFDDEVESVIMTTLSGKIQILANHIPYVNGIMPSVIKFKHKGETKYASVSGGFVQFSKNKAIILVDSAEWPEEVDRNRAESALERAKARLAAKEQKLDKKRAQMAIMRALARIKLTDKH